MTRGGETPYMGLGNGAPAAESRNMARGTGSKNKKNTGESECRVMVHDGTATAGWMPAHSTSRAMVLR